MLKNKRQTKIYSALVLLGGKASCRAIAETANMDVNGVSQTLGRMWEDVQPVDTDKKSGADWIYQLK